MVTVKQDFTDSASWLESQKGFFNENEVTEFEKAITIAKVYYKDNKFYPTDVNLLMHSLRCAITVAELNLYADAVIATILFALPRYCDAWQEEVKIFSPKVAELIDGVTKVTQIRKIGAFLDIATQQKEDVEVIRKMLLAMASDIRVVLIVLVGRGELMLNLKSCNDQALREKISVETVEIFAPLANRLGLWQIKWELEDLSFKYMHPEQYKKIANLLDETREERLDYIERIQDFISSQMDESGITGYQVSGRAKHIYSIWKKMKKKGYGFDDLFDIRAIRVLVPEVKDCYTVLGIVHTKYSPIPGEFDDYISNPKSNNYQSLHTCVVGPDSRIIEIQIRTFDMHDHAEYGIAAHWRYKESGDKNADSSTVFADKVAWLRQVLDWRDDITDKKEIAEVFKNEIFSDTIYVMTPNGKIIALPSGSTPIDFAYHVHSNVGNRCRGAKVDGQIVPLSTTLKNGQHVEILTVKEGGPSVNWLYDGFVKSSKAVSHIRRYIRNQNNEEFLSIGTDIFNRELHKFTANSRPSNDDIVIRLGYTNEKTLCIDLGNGELNPQKVRDSIMEMIEKIRQDSAPGIAEDRDVALIIQENATNSSKRNNGILVDGISGISTQIAKCCKPIPGDNIMGFISSGKGIVVHRSSCRDLTRQAKLFPEKVMNVSWGNESENAMFYADIEVIANDRVGLLSDLTTIFATEKISIAGIKSHTKQNKVFMLLTLSIRGNGLDFSHLTGKMLAVSGVNEVIRK